MTDSCSQTITFLGLLFEPTDVVLIRPIETWTEGARKRSRVLYKQTQYTTAGLILHAYVGRLNAMAEQTRANLFFGVCPRFGRHGFDLAWQIRTVRCLWSDIDDCTDLDELRARLQRAGLPEPTIIISSGNGFHVYWALSEPYLIDDVAAPPEVKIEWADINVKRKALHYFDEEGERVWLEHQQNGRPIPANRPPLSAKALRLQDVVQGIGSKIGGDHTHDLARLLRLPGTMNRKDQRNGREPVPCEIHSLTDKRYPFATFEKFAELSDAKQQREKIALVRLPEPKKITASRQNKLNDFLNRCALAPVGERSEADFALCCHAVEKGIDRAEVWAQVADIGKFGDRDEAYFDQTWSKAEQHTREKIYLKAAKRSSTPVLNGKASSNGKAHVTPAPSPEAHTADHSELQCNHTDISNATRFVEMHGPDCRYCFVWKKWLVWDGTRWDLDKTGHVYRKAKDVARQIFGEALEFHDDGEMKWAQYTAKANGIEAMLKLAAPELPILPAELDPNPWLFNCPNGTLDLQTGELREHRRDDFITKLCPTAYDPDASSYAWDRFLESIFALQPVIDFVQRLFGYSLTGDQREQVLPILWGDGSNGKSTLLNTFLHAVGDDYAMQAAPDLLMARKGESHPTDRADLFGRRIVSCIETDEDRRLSEALVKMLTGGEKVRARRMREDFWEFDPTHTVFLATNHKPEVRGDDHAIWRRLALIPFVVTFWNPDKGETGPQELRQDKALPDKLLQEAPGILAWAVRGCRDWLAGGLRMPDEVRGATSEYQTEQDRIAAFIADLCVTGSPALRVRAGHLYGEYKCWSEAGGEYPMTQTKFGKRIKAREGITAETSNGVWYVGIGLRHQLTEE